MKDEERQKYYTAKHSLKSKLASFNLYIDNFFNDLLFLRQCDDTNIVEKQLVTEVDNKLVFKTWESSGSEGAVKTRIKELIKDSKKDRPILNQDQKIPRLVTSNAESDAQDIDLQKFKRHFDVRVQDNAIQLLLYFTSLGVEIESLERVKWAKLKQPNMYYWEFFEALIDDIMAYHHKKFENIKKGAPLRTAYIGFDIIRCLYSLFDEEWKEQFEKLEKKYPTHSSDNAVHRVFVQKHAELFAKIQGMDSVKLDATGIYRCVKKLKRPYAPRINDVKKICKKLTKQRFLLWDNDSYSVNLNDKHKRNFISWVIQKTDDRNKIPPEVFIGSGSEEIMKYIHASK